MNEKTYSNIKALLYQGFSNIYWISYIKIVKLIVNNYSSMRKFQYMSLFLNSIVCVTIYLF